MGLIGYISADEIHEIREGIELEKENLNLFGKNFKLNIAFFSIFLTILFANFLTNFSDFYIKAFVIVFNLIVCFYLIKKSLSFLSKYRMANAAIYVLEDMLKDDSEFEQILTKENPTK